MRQISLRGPIVSDADKWIYDYFEMVCTTPGAFLAELEAANGDDVEILINSVGGYVTQAAEIYEAIRSYKGKVTGKVIGQACSCASFIACAMYCEISPIGEIFIHNCSGGVEGDYRAMQQARDALMQTNDNIILAYQEKTGLSKEKLQKMMDNNTTLSAREAVNLGFVDKISENSNYDAMTDERGMVAAVSGGMLPITNLSEQKRAALAAAMRGLSQMDGEKNIYQKREELMGKLSDFLASNADANNEHQALLEEAKKNAREEGIKAERARTEAIDQIAGNISADLVHDAKYVNPVTAEVLALSALQNGAVVTNDGMAASVTKTAVPAIATEAAGEAKNDVSVAPVETTGAVNVEQIAKMAADFVASNIHGVQTPAKNPLTGASGSTDDMDAMAKNMSASISRYL